MKKITKKSTAFFIAQCFYCTNIIIDLRDSSVSQFHEQTVSKLSGRVKRTGPKSPNLPYAGFLISEKYFSIIYLFIYQTHWNLKILKKISAIPVIFRMSIHLSTYISHNINIQISN
jgi:hypothetical protein